MAHRVGVSIQEAVWQQLRTLPVAERNRVINEALAREFVRIKRSGAIVAATASPTGPDTVAPDTEDRLRKNRERR